MICRFCGLNNNEDAAFCSRCGSPLRENSRPASSDSAIDDDKKTMRMVNQPDSRRSDGGVTMHDCGYPLLPGTQVCPKCHRPVSVTGGAPQNGGNSPKMTETDQRPSQQSGPGPKATERFVSPAHDNAAPKQTERFASPAQDDTAPKRTERIASPAQDDAEPRRTERFESPEQFDTSAKKTQRFVAPEYQGSSVNKQTVNIRQIPTPEPRETEPVVIPACSLTPIAREGEASPIPGKREYEGSEVILNRQNTDPDNLTITSQKQAALIFEDGKWYIEDRSAFKTTYIRVARRVELQDGDILAMGNREFKFFSNK